MKNKLSNLYDDFKASLILNPTENIPLKCTDNISFLEGLYIPEDKRDKDSKVNFAGRNQARDFMTQMYKKWESSIGAAASSFKLYSGLHAHIILFMTLGSIGDKVLIIPENAGGHYATHNLLCRLGLQVKECVVDKRNLCINVDKTEKLIESWKPKYIFIDRSDGLYYEDFSWLKKYDQTYKVFDASQYLLHILAKDYINPFDMGMDLILTTLHKNYPGPQKAALFTKKQDEKWEQIEIGMSSFISNSHPLDIFKAGLSFPNKKYLKEYSRNILKNTIALEKSLNNHGVRTVPRDFCKTITQQIWIPMDSEHDAFSLYKRLEQIHLYTNYRTLPYGFGKGLRLGTAAATRQGLTIDTATIIGQLIGEAYHTEKLSDSLIDRTANLIQQIKKNRQIY